MRTREIPRTEWANFLSSLKMQALDHPVSVRVEGEDVGDQVMIEGMPLVGMSLEKKGSAANAIELTVAEPNGVKHLTHWIEHPTKLAVEEDERGRVQVLDIEDDMHVKTLIFLRAP